APIATFPSRRTHTTVVEWTRTCTSEGRHGNPRGGGVLVCYRAGNMHELVVLFGGPSSERKVSVASAQNVASVLDQADAWFWAPGDEIYRIDRATLLAHERPFEIEFVPRSAPSYGSLQDALDDARVRGATFFLALHGGVGENGTVQKM